jgi:hypothetical protein
MNFNKSTIFEINTLMLASLSSVLNRQHKIYPLQRLANVRGRQCSQHWICIRDGSRNLYKYKIIKVKHILRKLRCEDINVLSLIIWNLMFTLVLDRDYISSVVRRRLDIIDCASSCSLSLGSHENGDSRNILTTQITVFFLLSLSYN